MPNEETLYPLEVELQGIPVSLQTKNAKHREAWKKQIAAAALHRRRETQRAADPRLGNGTASGIHSR
jgi:hypothetical protein